MTPEEILEECVTGWYEAIGYTDTPSLDVKAAMFKFGKLAFEAGREANYIAAEQYIEELLENGKLRHNSFEDYLKELYDKTGSSE
jgi:hypothetical protein